MKRLAILLLLLAQMALARTYSTSFPTVQNPISESGNWQTGLVYNGQALSNVKVDASHHAVGTELYANYNDSIALLTGTWGNDQCVEATLFINSAVSGTYNPEMELYVRSKMVAGSFRGYEFHFAPQATSGPFLQVAPYWGANFIDTTFPRQLQTADRVKLCVVGTLFTVYLNGVVVATGTDSTYADGQPGIGFFHFAGGDGLDSLWGYSAITANDGPGASGPPPPTGLTVIVQ